MSGEFDALEAPADALASADESLALFLGSPSKEWRRLT
jgi:hypothetical protein